MVKLSLASWLGSSGSSDNSRSDADRKRENRRSFAGFGTLTTPFSSKTNRMSTMPKAKAVPAQKVAAHKPVGDSKHTGRSSSSVGSTTESDSPLSSPVAAQSPAGPQPTMTELADTISRETAKLERYMRENGLPMPSFDVDAADDFPKLPEDIQRSRLEVIHATKQLRDLTVGPRESVRWGVWEVSLITPPPPRVPDSLLTDHRLFANPRPNT